VNNSKTFLGNVKQLSQLVNNINDQLAATITILLIFESAQHVSRNHLPIFRSVRLWLQ